MPLSIPDDVLLLIFEHLAGDVSLAQVGLVCRLWRSLSLPQLLRDIDLSSHNDGRKPERERAGSSIIGVVMADQTDELRPRNLVKRQRAFLRLMVGRPELCTQVKKFTWTLIWLDFDDQDLTDIDFQTWDVLRRLNNVTQLDLASIHGIGWCWMHRGLVRSIISSLDATRLQSLDLHHLQDEGALPDSRIMPDDIAEKYYHKWDSDYETGINDDLWERQEQGDAAIFPGPMWFPLRILRQNRLSSMVHLQIRLGFFEESRDSRNIITMFRETTEFIRSAKDTLQTISIAVGEDPELYCDELNWTARGRARSIFNHRTRPVYFHLAGAFLQRLLPVLIEERFPHLSQVELEGFRILRESTPTQWHPAHPDPDLTWQYIRDCPFIDEEFTTKANDDYRPPFCGYDYNDLTDEQLEELDDVLRRS